jgi:hypothetical protein
MFRHTGNLFLVNKDAIWYKHFEHMSDIWWTLLSVQLEVSELKYGSHMGNVGLRREVSMATI